MNKRTGHPSLIFKQSGDNVKSLGFTHDGDESIFKKEKLKHNIDPNSNEKCYVKKKVEKYTTNDYKKRKEYETYRIHNEDKPLIRNLINKSKKERV